MMKKNNFLLLWYDIVMKKFCLFILVLFFSCSCAFAQQNISFVYINGSNNNDAKMANWFDKGVRNFHKVVRKKFLTNQTIQKFCQADSTQLNIKEETIIFFWGYQSKLNLDFLKRRRERECCVHLICR